MTRLSYRRYAAHFLLSLSAVYLSHLIFEEHYNTLLILVIFIVSLVSEVGLSSASPQYCTTTAVLLLLQHRLTKLIGRQHTSGFTATQHNIVHFALSFFVISELEFYRQYISFRGFENWCTASEGFLRANIDSTFHTSRDPWFYTRDLPRSWRRYLDGDAEPRGFLSILLSRSMIVEALLYMLFPVMSGILNYPIKHIVNPSPDGESIFALVAGYNVFFEQSPVSPWKMILGLALLRVVRQTNYLAFWVVVRIFESIVGWRKGAREEVEWAARNQLDLYGERSR